MATLNTMKGDQGSGKRSAHQKAGVGLVAGLLAIAVAAMVTLVILTEPLELVKTALGGVIVLVGTGITAVLTMLRTDAAREEARSARVEAQSARAEMKGER